MTRTVALIMPSLNEAQSVEKTLGSVFNSTRLPDEIIVADGLSTDNTVELIKQFEGKGVPIKIVENELVYAGAGRNKAVLTSQCDTVLLLDFGNTVEPDWIEKMIAPFEKDSSLAFVSGAFKAIEESDFEHCVSAIH